MRKLKIPQNHSGISKTLRLPENLVNDIQILADLKNISFKQVKENNLCNDENSLLDSLDDFI